MTSAGKATRRYLGKLQDGKHVTHRRPGTFTGMTANQYSITGIATEGGGEICRERQRKAEEVERRTGKGKLGEIRK
jgi:hypothetical protein